MNCSLTTQVFFRFPCCRCQVTKVDKFGAVFIGVGFGILLLGLFTEFQAARLRKKWTKNGVLVIPPTKEIVLAILGRDTVTGPIAGDDFEEGMPFFDPDDELAAFDAQQQATLGSQRRS